MALRYLLRTKLRSQPQRVSTGGWLPSQSAPLRAVGSTDPPQRPTGRTQFCIEESTSFLPFARTGAGEQCGCVELPANTDARRRPIAAVFLLSHIQVCWMRRRLRRSSPSTGLHLPHHDLLPSELALIAALAAVVVLWLDRI